MIAQDIRPEDSVDAVSPPPHQLLVDVGQIHREDAVGVDRQPFESQPNIAQRIKVVGSTFYPTTPDLPGVHHGNFFGSTIVQIDDGTGCPGLEHDGYSPVVE